MFKIPPGSVIKLHVLVGFGCYNKMHRMSGLNSRHDFSQFRELGKSQIRVPAWLVLVWPFFLAGLQIAALLLYPHTVGKSMSSSFYKGANPIMRVLITSQRLQLQILSHWGLWLQYMNLGAHTQSITMVTVNGKVTLKFMFPPLWKVE